MSKSWSNQSIKRLEINNKELKKLDKKYIIDGAFVSLQAQDALYRAVTEWTPNLEQTLLDDAAIEQIVASRSAEECEELVHSLATSLFPLLQKSITDTKSSDDRLKKRLFPRKITSN